MSTRFIADRFLPRPLLALAATFFAACTLLTCGAVRADVYSDVPEATGDRLVYTLNFDNSDSYNTAGATYTTNNAASIAYGSFSRVGYYMTLSDGTNTQYAYASFDSAGFNFNASKLGLPTVQSGEFYNQSVSNMNVVSNVPGIANATGLSTGTVQFWPSDYASDPNTNPSVFDYHDINGNTSAGYSHMEIGNTAAAQTILVASSWGGNGNNNVLGLGNQPTGNPDWTFNNNAANYTLKELQVVVNNTPAVLPAAPLAPTAVTNLDHTLSNYHLVYQETVPTNPAFSPNGVNYTQDFSHAANVQNFDRVAYVMELKNSSGAEQFASVSFNSAGLVTDPTKIGIPSTNTGEVYNSPLSDLHVASNVAGVVTGDHIATGTIQFWPSNYGPDGNAFDYNDNGFNSTQGYGHMEIGNTAAGQTIFAFNNWNGGGTPDIGIGNDPNYVPANGAFGGPQPDWTFSGAAGNWTVENIYVLVHSVPEPSSLGLLAIAGLTGLMVARRRTAVQQLVR